MNINQIPKFNPIYQNYYLMPVISNDPINFPSRTNQFPIPLSINSFIPPNNLQYPIMPLMLPDQLLYSNQPSFLPRLLYTPQTNQLTNLNQLMMYQNISNGNKIIDDDNSLMNRQKLNAKENVPENNFDNNNLLNKNENNDIKEKKDINNLMPKKLFITHDTNKLYKKNIANIDFEKNKISGNNNINLNLLNKNKEIINNSLEINNLLTINEKNNDAKESKIKLSLFTTSNKDLNASNINSSINNLDNNNILLNNNLNNEQNQSINSLNNKDFNNNLNYEINNKDLFNLQQNDLKNDKIKYYRCSYKDCNKVFLKQSNLKDHIRTHTGEKPYICSHPGCGKTFSQHGNLKKHEKIHLGNKKYYCSYPNCGKKFSASYNLKIHYRCHTGEKPYKCNFPNCGRSFYDKGNLKYHEKNMHALENMEYPYSCEHMGCNAKFKTKFDKLKHHSEMEVDCFVERKELIKLIQRYKIFFRKILVKNKIDASKNEIVLKLKKNYEEIQKKLIDQELFNHYLGDKFDNDCTNIEEITDIEKNEENNNENEINSNNLDKSVIISKNVNINEISLKEGNQ